MIKRTILLLLSLMILQCAAAQTVERDTLLAASQANQLTIKTDNSGIYITVKNLNGRGENFYYDTSLPKSKSWKDNTVTTFKDVKDIRIVEIEGKKLRIEFVNMNSDQNSLSYEIPDPENRIVQTYTGERYRNFGINLSKNGKGSWSLVSTGWGLGWVTPVNAVPDLHTAMGRSMEWTWAIVAGAKWAYGPHSITMGLGLDWRNYTIKNGTYFNKEDNGEITLRRFDVGTTDCKSRLLTFSLQIPVLYDFKFGRHNNFGVTVGPILNFNTGGNIKNQYKLDNKKYTVKTGDIGQTPVTVDLMGAIHWHGIGIYARYAPMKVLKTNTGLDFNSFSTGIILLL